MPRRPRDQDGVFTSAGARERFVRMDGLAKRLAVGPANVRPNEVGIHVGEGVLEGDLEPDPRFL